MSEYQKEAKIVVIAMKADVHPQTARKYIRAAKPPAELQRKHNWRARPDPLAAIWPTAEQMLAQAPELEAKELFEYLRGLAGRPTPGDLSNPGSQARGRTRAAPSQTPGGGSPHLTDERSKSKVHLSSETEAGSAGEQPAKG
ncbi:MAG TPA: hypothetical protein VGY56_00860 [Verrucomicrobiae bacterium]|nr:hypothetical protein [Verrucomicrobiae bacterium]